MGYEHQHHHHDNNPPQPPRVLTYTGDGFDSTFLASDAKNWSPNAVPQPGDVLLMHPVDINSGSMTVNNDALAGTVLILTIDEVNPFGELAGITMDAASTVNLVANEHGETFFSTLGGTLNFIADSSFAGSGQFFTNTNLTGNAVLTLQPNPTGILSGETMELGGTVGSGLTFNVTGTPGGPPDVAIRVDHPDTFEGTINLPTVTGNLDAVIFEGIQASSGQLRNDLLTMFDAGGNILSMARVTGGPAVGGTDGLELQVTSVGTSLTEIGHTVISGTVIPLTT
jgi:hypothetical protein